MGVKGLKTFSLRALVHTAHWGLWQLCSIQIHVLLTCFLTVNFNCDRRCCVSGTVCSSTEASSYFWSALTSSCNILTPFYAAEAQPTYSTCSAAFQIVLTSPAVMSSFRSCLHCHINVQLCNCHVLSSYIVTVIVITVAHS